MSRIPLRFFIEQLRDRNRIVFTGNSTCTSFILGFALLQPLFTSEMSVLVA